MSYILLFMIKMFNQLINDENVKNVMIIENVKTFFFYISGACMCCIACSSKVMHLLNIYRPCIWLMII